MRSFIAQGVDVIAFSPVVETGWETGAPGEPRRRAFRVVLVDRAVDVREDLYVTFIGSDFMEEGRSAAATGWPRRPEGKAATSWNWWAPPGSAPAIDRKTGFEEILEEYPEMKIIAIPDRRLHPRQGQGSDGGLPEGADGEEITGLLPTTTTWRMGAIQAMEEPGMKPGEDILIVSDRRRARRVRGHGRRQAQLHACECNPLIGPQIFDARRGWPMAARSRSGSSPRRASTTTDGRRRCCRRESTRRNRAGAGTVAASWEV